MKLLNFALIIFLFISIRSNGQTEPTKYTRCEISYKNGSMKKAMIKERDLLVKNKIFLYDKVEPADTTSIDHITIDSVSYFLRRTKGTRPFIVVERIIEGKINFYMSPRSVSDDRFYLEKDSSFQELRVVIKELPGRTISVDEYKSTLSVVTADCPAVRAEIDNMPFNFKTLRKYIVKYNTQCGWMKSLDKKPITDKGLFLSGITVGFLSSNVKTDFSRFPSFSGSPYGQSEGTLSGFFLGYSFKRSFGKYSRVSFLNDLLFEQVTGKTSYGALGSVYYDLKEITDHLGIGLSVFKAPKSKVNVDIGAAIFTTYRIVNNSHHDITSYKYYNAQTNSFIFDPKNFPVEYSKFTLCPEFYLLGTYRNYGLKYQYVVANVNLPNLDNGSSSRISFTYYLKR